MDRHAALEIIPMLVTASQTTADTVAVYRRFASEAELKPFSDAIGQLVGAYYDVIACIVREHPDLDPGGFAARTE
jgi:hypothetical protein